MAVVENVQRKSARKPAARKAAAGLKPSVGPSVLAEIHELAWTGQHARAIELCTHTLATTPGGKPLAIESQLDLLDMRAESYIALGKLDLAAQDAAAMLDLADREKSPAPKAQAMIRSAIVQMRQGDFKPALKSATSSTKAARQLREKRLVAESLLVLGEVQGRSGSYATAVKTAQQAAEMSRALGDPSGEGRANWVAAMALHQLGRTKEAHSAAQRALELCSRAGDRYGVGNALILSSHTEPDFAQAYRSIRQATQAFEAAGYVERRSVALGNLAIDYDELGLHHHADRLHVEIVPLTREIGARQRHANALVNWVNTELSLGDFEAARRLLRELAPIVASLSDPGMDVSLDHYAGDLALAEGDPAAAARHYQAATEIAHKAELGMESVLLSKLGEAQLARGKKTAALAATAKATAVHRAHSFAKPDRW